MSDTFSDVQPGLVPMFSASADNLDPANLSAMFGIKVFVLCPLYAKWSDYSWNFEVYYGKDFIFSPDEAFSKLGMWEQVVVHLMRDLLYKGRHIVTDNWYTSLCLGEYLLTRDTLLTSIGTPEVTNGRKADQASVHLRPRNGNTPVVKYQDKKKVYVLTTFHTVSLVKKSPKYFGDKASVYFKPLHIERYNALMRSDLLNSFLAYRNTSPTYKKDFMHFILDVLDDLSAQHSKDAKAVVKKDQEQIAHPISYHRRRPSLNFSTVSSPAHSTRNRSHVASAPRNSA
ncbi:hypothetical protein E2C01_056859 [Portunus trituberculatus]|uniref:PiggyBac transposable element-derived protein domain-containing protein n=1 Tax=Portunus trituberculatus TaxID=210409 RepID=A0A5B7GYV3_PORTR|nr:hypothetical protein [Portunus trituberculatus]